MSSSSSKKTLQIWASGSGNNAENIIRFFKSNPQHGIVVHSVMTDNPSAGVIERCRRLDVPCIVTDSHSRRSTAYLPKLLEMGIDYIVLAGYLKKVAPAFIDAFLNRIINIHPSLLPKFGGKGMHGEHVHRAVLNSEEVKTGITIHLVNEEYDQGEHLAQFEVELTKRDTLEDVKRKIANLEMEHFPRILKNFIVGTNNTSG